jgi:hypothetical protein
MAMGNKLAQVLEAEGKPSDALAMNQLALATEDMTGNTDNRAEIKRNIERLQKTGAPTTLVDARQALDRMHTFPIAKTADFDGSGAFKMVIAGGRIEENALVEGSPEMRTLTAVPNQLKLPDVLPPGSKAHLFRGGDLYCASGSSTCQLRLFPRVNVSAARPHVKRKDAAALNQR